MFHRHAALSLSCLLLLLLELQYSVAVSKRFPVLKRAIFSQRFGKRAPPQFLSQRFGKRGDSDMNEMVKSRRMAFSQRFGKRAVWSPPLYMHDPFTADYYGWRTTGGRYPGNWGFY